MNKVWLLIWLGIAKNFQLKITYEDFTKSWFVELTFYKIYSSSNIQFVDWLFYQKSIIEYNVHIPHHIYEKIFHFIFQIDDFMIWSKVFNKI